MMQVSEVIKRTGLSRKAIYLYEERGLLSPSKKPAGELREYRQFSDQDVERLEVISRLRKLGIPIADIEKIINGFQTDLIFQNHLRDQQRQLSQLLEQMSEVSRILESLPPNSQYGHLEQIIKNSPIQENVSAEVRFVDAEIAESDKRRVAMLLYEAFIDRPINTQERWEAWYTLLDSLESYVTPETLEAYEDFYGDLTTEQLCRDYDLRRELVCGYTTFTASDEERKAQEIMEELRNLLRNNDYFEYWNQYFRKIVSHKGQDSRTSDCIAVLSEVFSDYNRHFENMFNRCLTPLLQNQEGLLIQDVLVTRMNGANMFDNYGLIFFDFYNHTLRQVRFGEAALK